MRQRQRKIKREKRDISGIVSSERQRTVSPRKPLQYEIVPQSSNGNPLPSLLAGKSLVQERKDLGHAELYVFKVQLLLSVLLHFEQIVELEIEFQQAPITSCQQPGQ